MTTFLIIVTVVEIVLVLGVIASYLYLVGKSLSVSSAYLGKVAFGVRAIETQTTPIGSGVVRINQQLTGIAAALDGVATLATGAADQAEA